MEIELANEIKEQPEPKGEFEGYWDRSAKVLSLFLEDGEGKEQLICATPSSIDCKGFSRGDCKSDGDIPVKVKKIILEAL